MSEGRLIDEDCLTPERYPTDVERSTGAARWKRKGVAGLTSQVRWNDAVRWRANKVVMVERGGLDL